MTKEYIFKFKSNISAVQIPENLNNPFDHNIPEIARLAGQDFQKFIASESKEWRHDFNVQKGKMFGVLVIQKGENFYYLGTISGKLLGDSKCDKFVPSVFKDSTDDYFINKGMTELTKIGRLIKQSKNQVEINELKEKRKLKSLALQKQLFENYSFLNIHGQKKNVVEIFEQSLHGKPPAAAGECAAPKLLQFALEHNLKPIAIAEFWWGNPPKNNERDHTVFYPACKNKCRPILEYMLNDKELFTSAKK